MQSKNSHRWTEWKKLGVARELARRLERKQGTVAIVLSREMSTTNLTDFWMTYSASTPLQNGGKSWEWQESWQEDWSGNKARTWDIGCEIQFGEYGRGILRSVGRSPQLDQVMTLRIALCHYVSKAEVQLESPRPKTTSGGAAGKRRSTAQCLTPFRAIRMRASISKFFGKIVLQAGSRKKGHKVQFSVLSCRGTAELQSHRLIRTCEDGL